MQNKELVYKEEDGSLVVIIPDVIKVFMSYRQLNVTSPESAGVLIGERRGSHIVIKTVSEPNNNDIRSRFTVNRIGTHHQQKVDQAFIDSKGTSQYVGEWHTHPEDIPTPSGLDFESWNENLNSNLPLILIIVGRKQFWVAKKYNQKIITLTEI
jgi:integrative and conjugative element protein (TIGR02256 family)